MIKRLIYLGIAAALVAGIIAYRMYNKPHADLQKAKPALMLSAVELNAYFENNEEKANADLLNKVLDIQGKLIEVRTTEGKVQAILDCESELSNVVCEMDPRSAADVNQLKPGEIYVFRGTCSGKLMDVVLNQCVLINK